MAVICLITTGQPSTNPRLVKEADALVEAGHTVRVLCAHWAVWADVADRTFLQSRRFQCTYVGGRRSVRSLPHLWTRVRHRVGRELVRFPGVKATRHWALSRVTPELQRASQRIEADLYIAHNLGALPAAASAARQHGAAFGFDAEDFHSGMSPNSADLSPTDVAIDTIERELLPRCDYVTAASPLIALSYARKYPIPTPHTILNVFPLNERPSTFRPSSRHAPLRVCWFSQTLGLGRGLEDVIRAMGTLVEHDLELHLLGHCSIEYRKTLERTSVAAGFPKASIHFHSPIRPDLVVSWASQFDVGLAAEQPTSTNANICLSNKLFSYLLSGNAVIATATDGQRQLMESSPGAGFCYQPGDAAGLAAKLRVWCEDRDKLAAARRRAWDYGTVRFNWDFEKSKFLHIVQTLLERRHRRIA
jgi:glycosyltransferase involved in cell wall biosynthesis